MYGVLNRMLANAPITWHYSITTASNNNNNKAETPAVDCWPGTFKDTGTERCTKCPENKISEDKADICSECPQGTAANEQHTECGKSNTFSGMFDKFPMLKWARTVH